MARIRFRTLDCGPGGVRQPGQICRVPDEIPAGEAAQLVAGGFAEWADPEAPASAAEHRAETNEPVTGKPAAEKAGERKEKRKRKG